MSIGWWRDADGNFGTHRTSYLPAQDRQLVTEHHDLQILGAIRSKPEQHQGEDPLDQNVKDGEDHGR